MVVTRLARLLGPLLALAATGQDAAAAGPSFDCTKARTADERLICSDPDLSAADAAVGTAFRAWIDALGDDEAARTEVRAEQRDWIARRNRACALSGTPSAAGDRDDQRQCLKTALGRRAVQLAGYQADPSLAAALRRTTTDQRRPRSRAVVYAAVPKIDDSDIEGAAAFNQAIARFLTAESNSFFKDAAELPDHYEPELTIDYEAYLPVPGVVSVQFHADGVLGNGFVYDAALTVDLSLGRMLGAADLFSGRGWVDTVMAKCRAALARTGDAAETCTAEDLGTLRTWRFEPGQAVASLLLPGKERREIPVPYGQLAAHWKPDSPLARSAPQPVSGAAHSAAVPKSDESDRATVLDESRFRSFRIGTPAEALFKNRRLVPDQNSRAEAGADGCYYANLPDAPDDASFLIDQNRLVRIDVFSADVVTPAGLRVGDSLAKLRRAFADDAFFQKTNRPQPGEEQDHTYLTSPGPGSRNGIAYTVSEGKIIAIMVGDTDALSWYEGCI